MGSAWNGREGSLARRYAGYLYALTGLFAFRVLAQLLQARWDVPILPPFEAWHGAALPYPVLVASQAAIFLAMLVLASRVRRDTLAPGPWRHWLCFGFGGLYFAVMLFRLLAGLTVLSDVPWFAKPLPAFFHLVVAAFLLLLGHYLFVAARRRDTARTRMA